MFTQIAFSGIMLLIFVAILDFLKVTKNAARYAAEICVVVAAGLALDHYRPVIVAFAADHPYWFWGYIAPGIALLAGVLHEELTAPTGFIFVGSLLAFIPVINIIMVTIAFTMIAWTVISDPQYMWRGMKDRFNFSKKD